MRNEFVEYKEFRILKAGMLEPHKDAVLPTGEDDRECLDDSVAEHGAAVCLVVSAKPDKTSGLYQIHDGVTRWKSALDAHGVDAELPCNLAIVKDPRAFALTCMSIGRRRSSGQRILAYLEMHRKDVLKAAEIMKDKGSLVTRDHRAGHVTGMVNIGKYENFKAEKIAEKLRVSDKDVRLGIELLECMESKLRASWNRGSLVVPSEPLDMEKDDDRDYFNALKKVHIGLLSGSTPIRRWKPAVGGLAKTQDRPRPPIDHGMLGCSALRTLINSVKHWDSISAGLKQRIATDWEELRELAKQVHLD